MHALKKFSMVITFAALSLSGSAAWATGENSFLATAVLEALKVVPPRLATITATLTLPFRSTNGTTTEGTIARAPVFNTRRVTSVRPRNRGFDVECENIRLYFGQPFANGLPIATFCDNKIPGLECKQTFTGTENEERICDASEELELRDIQFQKQQVVKPEDNVKNIAGIVDVELSDLRLENTVVGLDALKALIKRGLIYAVMNSAFTAELCPATDVDPDACLDIDDDDPCRCHDGDPATPEIIYTPPAPDPKTGIVIDGDLRGTLQIPRKKR